MLVKIKIIDKRFPLPGYQTPGAAAFDIYSRQDVFIRPREIKILPSNLIIKVPRGYVLVISARSGLAPKKGLILANGIGIVDQDYYGPKDEIGISVMNVSKKKVKIKAGERVAQGIILPLVKAEWAELKSIAKKSRGGFGSSD